jgi:micrococcal nuclease
MSVWNEYDVTVQKIIDGDTVDVDIHLGFGIILTDERVRIVGIDTEESRTSDKVEDLFGEAAKKRVKELLLHGENVRLITQEDKHGEDMKGKFGRVLGDFRLTNGKTLTETLIEEHFAVPYHGQNKSEIQKEHLKNREWLLNHGIVDRALYNELKLQQVL